ncbi:MAG: D-allose ABC transporter permease [Clostridiales bacterium]|nr:D-allose ABC transporter permease [Clostridiales bacterium]MCI2161120.1 D-allose ABC transporter permease [Oscillospiraceae bacterium]MCI1961339.1 D-allose ABC transporter permease [Clostridiales bacterium]MCI2021780.1 D-allose ABC transporter permease [Clostridiales bacterium]MCI2026567.1 D-allose ABC transporter permease [Clostridiales bacterium]
MKTKTIEKKKFTFSDYWDRYSTITILAIMIVVFGILRPSSFLTTGNLIKIMEQSSITILLGLGEFFAILLGGIDLSVSSIMALSGAVTAKLMINAGFDPWMSILVGIIFFGLFVGLVNGVLVTATGLPPFIITLGTQAILRSLVYIVTDARAVSGLPASFSTSIGGKLFGVVPVPILVALIAAAALTFFTVKCQSGRNLYALGGNTQSAWYAGITVKKHTIIAFAISGLCAALAGMVNIARLAAAEPNAGTGYETYAIEAVIIGGASFFGGIGKIPKVIIGGLIIGVINNGLNMVGVSSYYQQLAMGCLLIIAVTLDRFFGASRKS